MAQVVRLRFSIDAKFLSIDAVIGRINYEKDDEPEPEALEYVDLGSAATQIEVPDPDTEISARHRCGF